MVRRCSVYAYPSRPEIDRGTEAMMFWEIRRGIFRLAA